jgi:hypothetical protein
MSEATQRALRTLAQNLVLDVLFAVFTVAVPLVSGDTVDWQLLGLAAGKTALATAASFIHRKLNEVRSRSIEG